MLSSRVVSWPSLDGARVVSAFNCCCSCWWWDLARVGLRFVFDRGGGFTDAATAQGAGLPGFTRGWRETGGFDMLRGDAGDSTLRTEDWGIHLRTTSRWTLLLSTAHVAVLCTTSSLTRSLFSKWCKCITSLHIYTLPLPPPPLTRWHRRIRNCPPRLERVPHAAASLVMKPGTLSNGGTLTRTQTRVMSLIHVICDVISLKHLWLSSIIGTTTICHVQLTTLIDGAVVVAFGEHGLILEESGLNRAHLSRIVKCESVDVLDVDQSTNRGLI